MKPRLPVSRAALALGAIVALGGAFMGHQLSHPPLPSHLSLQMKPSPVTGGGGVYDLGLARFDGAFGHFMRTVVWAYSGRKELGEKARMPEFSVTRFVTADFPPAFISAGNADPLLPHSRALAEALASRGVRVDSLFFPDDFRPKLPHEYQFNLDTGAGREALERSVRFLKATAY